MPTIPITQVRGLAGLTVHVASFYTVVWPMLNEETGGYNKTGMVIAVCAILELATRPYSLPADKLKSGGDASNAAKDVPRNWLPSSIALGSLFFTLHCMFTDSSTVIAWSWTGYQDGHPRGPLPHLHGSITLLAQSLGLIIPVILPPSMSSALLGHPLWFAYGCASAFVMYRFRDWTGFLGGLNFAVFCTSIIPLVLSQSCAWQSDKAGRRYFVAFFVAIVFYVANVFTVAYAFVPGGPYLRERTNLCVSLCTISFHVQRSPQSPHGAVGWYHACLPFSVQSIDQVQLPLGYPEFNTYSNHRDPVSFIPPIRSSHTLPLSRCWSETIQTWDKDL